MSAPTTVCTTIQFSVPPTNSAPPFFNLNADADGTRKQNYFLETKEVHVENIRGRESELTLDSEGFRFFQTTSVMTEGFEDDEKVKSTYYDDCERTLKEITGASRIVLFDHTIHKTRQNVADEDSSKRQPVTIAHVDQTPRSPRSSSSTRLRPQPCSVAS